MERVDTKPVGVLGRIVIPENLRQLLDMETGTELDFYVDGPALILLPKGKHYPTGCAICRAPDCHITVHHREICPNCVTRILDADTDRTIAEC